MDLAAIQHAIEDLPREQQAALAAWLAERDQEEWDAEIERDFSTGGAAIHARRGDEGRRSRRQVPSIRGRPTAEAVTRL